MSTLTSPSYRVVSNHIIAEVRQKLSNNQNALFALRAYEPGELIAHFNAGSISAEPTYLTVQVGIGKHITLQPAFLQYINHGCEPNVFFNTTSMQLVALKQILADEEMTFFYPSTEWQMTQTFKCYCGSIQCIGDVKGAAFLTTKMQDRYQLTEFIQQQLAKRKRPSRKVA